MHLRICSCMLWSRTGGKEGDVWGGCRWVSGWVGGDPLERHGAGTLGFCHFLS